MPDILQEVTIAVSPEKVFEALINHHALEAWWATYADIEPTEGSTSTLQVRFGEDAYIHRFDVVKAEPQHTVEWLTRNSLPEWNGTSITWELSPVESGTRVLLGQYGYATADGIYAVCSYHWSIYLTSLKDYLEKGKGNPFPFVD